MCGVVMEFRVQKFLDQKGNLVGMAIADSFIIGKVSPQVNTIECLYSADSPEQLIHILHSSLMEQMRIVSAMTSDLNYFLAQT